MADTTPWVVQLRDEKGKSHKLELEHGASTSIRALKREVNAVTKIPQYKQVWKAGFPPRIVFSPLVQLDGSSPIFTVVSDRDVIVLQSATAEQLNAAIEAAAAERAAATSTAEPASAPSTPSTQAKSLSASARATGAAAASPAAAAAAASSAAAGAIRTDRRGSGAGAASPPAGLVRTAGAAAGTLVARSPSAGADTSGAARVAALVVPKKKRRKKNAFPGAARTIEGGPAEAPKDEVAAMRQAEDGVLGALLQAARGGSQMGHLLGDWNPGNRTLFKSLRADLRVAREAIGRETEATEKLAAVRLGRVVFRELEDGTGRVEVIWTDQKQKQRRECVPDVPPFLLAAVLITLYEDDDEQVAVNLSPLNMAQVSPRTFWALAKYGEVGPSRSFGDALKQIAPNLDWSKFDVDSRQRRQPARYGEYVTS